MRKVVCDRCGSEAEFNDRANVFAVTVSTTHVRTTNAAEHKFDLCQPCKTALIKFFEPLPQAG